jgi:BMFP domain-containing protein YqiC
MSNPVDTYEPLVHEVSATVRMGAHSNGTWVKVSDYGAAIRRAERAEVENVCARARIEKCESVNDALTVRVADLEAKLAEAERDLRLCKGHDIVSKFRMLAAERDDLLDKLIAERTRVADLEAKLAAAETERDALRNSFKCFQCGEVFTDFIAARNHFGFYPADVPVCRVDGGTAATIYHLRRKIADYQLREETEGAESQLQRAALQGDHARALRRAEEEGYAKGLGDFAAERTRREALEARIAELEADAERFRWIEAQGMWALNEALERYPHGPISMAIDAARAALSGGEPKHG